MDYDNGKIEHINKNKLDNRLCNSKYNKTITYHNEIWKYFYLDNNYLVSNLGRVKNIKYNRIIKFSLNKNYPHVRIVINNKLKTYDIHRMVMLTFKHDEYFEGAIVNHINGIKIDNRLENLEWCTPKENTRHAFNIGLMVPTKGQQHGNSKLNEKQVNIIRLAYKNKYFNQTELSKIFNVKPNTISNTVNNINWKHI
jgi:hypothetical protein